MNRIRFNFTAVKRVLRHCAVSRVNILGSGWYLQTRTYLYRCLEWSLSFDYLGCYFGRRASSALGFWGEGVHLASGGYWTDVLGFQLQKDVPVGSGSFRSHLLQFTLKTCVRARSRIEVATAVHRKRRPPIPSRSKRFLLKRSQSSAHSSNRVNIGRQQRQFLSDSFDCRLVVTWKELLVLYGIFYKVLLMFQVFMVIVVGVCCLINDTGLHNSWGRGHAESLMVINNALQFLFHFWLSMIMPQIIVFDLKLMRWVFPWLSLFHNFQDIKRAYRSIFIVLRHDEIVQIGTRAQLWPSAYLRSWPHLFILEIKY